MDEALYINPNEDIASAYNALLAIDDIDLKLFGDKDLKKRITSNALQIIDKALQQIAVNYEDEED